jgi:hypothetical protein
MDMKSKFVIFLTLSFFVFQLRANEKSNKKDTLVVYLVESDSALSVDLVIKNICSDSIWVPTQFKNLFLNWESQFGLRVITYRNQKSFILRDYPEPLKMEKYLSFYNEKFYLLPPQEQIIYHINLEYYFALMDMDVEMGVEIYLHFYCIRYTKKTDTEPMEIDITTNYVKVNK